MLKLNSFSLFFVFIAFFYFSEINLAAKKPKAVEKKISKIHQEAIEALIKSPDRTITLSKEALKLAQEKELKKLIAKSFYIQGRGYFEIGNIKKSTDSHNEALSIFTEIKDYKAIAKVNEYLAYLYRQRARYNTSINHYRLAIDAYKEIQDTVKWASALNNVANIHWQKGLYDRALIEQTECLNLRKKIDDEKGMSMSYNNLAVIYKDQGRYDLALEYLLNSLELEERLNDKKGIAYTVNLIGSVHWNLGNYNEALEFYQRSLKIRQELGDKEGVAASMVSIGNTCKKMRMYNISLQYFQNALENFEDLGQQNNVAFCMNEIATAYSNLEMYDKAVDYYQQTLKLREERGDKILIANTLKNIGITYKKMKKYNYAIDNYNKALNIFSSLNNKPGQLTIESYKGNIFKDTENNLKALNHYLKSYSLASEISDFDNLLYTSKQIADIYYKIKNYKLASDYLKTHIKIQDSIANKALALEVEKKIAQYEVDKKEEEISYINKINKLEFSRQEAVIKRKNWITNILFGGLLVILFFLIVLFLQKKKVNLTNSELKNEKDKSERLLLNVLPVKVADDLKTFGSSQPELFSNVTIFFSDLVNFTEISSELKPKDLIDELNNLFTRFDEIMIKHGCERIKTIGDAYLSVCGMPDPEPDNAERIIRAAIDIMDYVNERNINNFVEWKIRVGIHTGNVVGGIVGSRKYIYDIFGDSVNIASRMETNSEAMHINVSEATYNIVKSKFDFVERPPIKVKGKGNMKMFYLQF